MCCWMQEELASFFIMVSLKCRNSTIYTHLRPASSLVAWKRLVCNSKSRPKSTFILWLAVQDRLATKTRLFKWNITTDATCSLCQQHSEDIQHLFFKCVYSEEIWRTVLLQELGVVGPFLTLMQKFVGLL